MTKAEVNREMTLADACNAIARLEKENAEYKELFGGCSTCKRTCDIGNCCDPRTKDGYLIDKVKVITKRQKLLKENAELKKELKEWKDEWQEQVQKATDEGYARTLQTVQLTKAKELLKGWLGDFYSPKAFYQQRAELVEQSEQFISEVEK